VCPLFSAFGPEPVRQRLDLGDARVLVTTATLYRRKVAPSGMSNGIIAPLTHGVTSIVDSPTSMLVVT
jgi:hypothetical protein